MSDLGTVISARLTAARATEAGIPGSGWFAKLDTALQEKLRAKAASNAVLHSRKANMLIVDKMSEDMIRILEDLFPSYNKVEYTLYSTFGSDVEALRSAIYTSLFEDLLVDGLIIHVGGFQDTHVVHGRHVHCEQVATGPMEYARAVRRYCVKEQLYRNAVAVKLKIGEEKLPWEMLPLSSDEEHDCKDPVLCTKKAACMVFDINVIPLSQQQACASMMQHNCDVAEALVLVEENSMLGGSGYISGTKIRAEFSAADQLISYSSDAGGAPEFPPISASVLREWLMRSAAHWFGSTFTFEIVQEYGPFVRIQITRIPGVLDMNVTHRLWDLNSGRENGGVMIVSVPKLKDLAVSPHYESNYETVEVAVSEKTYKAAHEYALSLTATDFKRANIRRKLNELNNRVIVKGTMVEIAEPLHPDVADVVAMELFVKCYIERYDSSQVFKLTTARMSDAKLRAGSSNNVLRTMLGKAMSAVQDWWADSVTDHLRLALDHAIERRMIDKRLLATLTAPYTEYNTSVQAKGTDFCLKNAVERVGGYLFMLLRNVPSGEGANQVVGDNSTLNVPEVDAVSVSDDCARTPSVIRTQREELPVVQHHSVTEEYREMHILESDDYVGEFISDAISNELSRVVAEVNIRADTGPDEQALCLRTHHVELTVDLDNHEMYDRARVDVGDCETIINEQYSNTFPKVAVADMSADYDLASHGLLNYTLNVPYLRMPLDNIVGSDRAVYMSKLNGPNRPNAPSTSRNLLTGVVKRNADPNVIKLPQDYGVSKRMWENFLQYRCRSDVKELLAEYKSQGIHVAFPNLMRWSARVGAEKVARVVKLFEDNEAMMFDYALNEFLLQFKGKVKPTLSANADRLFAKFQTIMHYTTEINMFWSAMFADLTARYNAMLLPNIHVGVRGNDNDKRDHIRKYHPWRNKNLVYVQLDMSEYDKSQDSRAREFFDIMHAELGMSDECVKKWSNGQTYNVARSMSLGMKLIVPLQMKSGVGTTLWGNSAYAQAIAAWVMPTVKYELGQGDDLYDVLDEDSFHPEVIVDIAASVFNMPVKLITQTIMPMRTGYFCGKFVVYDERKQEVYLVPDPIKAVESLSRPITEDEAKFEEMYVSFQDRMVMWKSDFPQTIFDHMVSKWYEAPELRATYLVDALLSIGSTKSKFRELWDKELSKVK